MVETLCDDPFESFVIYDSMYNIQVKQKLIQGGSFFFYSLFYEMDFHFRLRTLWTGTCHVSMFYRNK